MSKKVIDVKRIDKKYVKDDCVQVMFGFDQGMTIENTKTNSTLFHLEKKKSGYVNQYLEDDRRKDFPYGSIPVHKTIKGLRIFSKTNQILNFNTVYKITYQHEDIFGDKNDSTVYVRAIKDGDSALLLSGNYNAELEMNIDMIKNLEVLGKLKIKRSTDPVIARIINRKIPKEELEKQRKLAKTKTYKK